MDVRSETNLADVHPDLARVVRTASQRPQPFLVIHGIRTLAEEKQHVADGSSQTLHSRHLPGITGLACAIDFACIDNGHISWNPMLYRAAWLQIQRTAAELKVKVEWGGDWEHLKDWGHVQLPWNLYP